MSTRSTGKLVALKAWHFIVVAVRWLPRKLFITFPRYVIARQAASKKLVVFTGSLALCLVVAGIISIGGATKADAAVVDNSSGIPADVQTEAENECIETGFGAAQVSWVSALNNPLEDQDVPATAGEALPLQWNVAGYFCSDANAQADSLLYTNFKAKTVTVTPNGNASSLVNQSTEVQYNTNDRWTTPITNTNNFTFDVPDTTTPGTHTYYMNVNYQAINEFNVTNPKTQYQCVGNNDNDPNAPYYYRGSLTDFQGYTNVPGHVSTPPTPCPMQPLTIDFSIVVQVTGCTVNCTNIDGDVSSYDPQTGTLTRLNNVQVELDDTTNRSITYGYTNNGTPGNYQYRIPIHVGDSFNLSVASPLNYTYYIRVETHPYATDCPLDTQTAPFTPTNTYCNLYSNYQYQTEGGAAGSTGHAGATKGSFILNRGVDQSYDFVQLTGPPPTFSCNGTLSPSTVDAAAPFSAVAAFNYKGGPITDGSAQVTYSVPSAGIGPTTMPLTFTGATTGTIVGTLNNLKINAVGSYPASATLTYQGGTVAQCTGTIVVANQPYFRVYGGDTSVGDAFKSGASCTINLTPVGIYGWPNPNLTGANAWNGGAGSQFGELATGQIIGAASAANVGTPPDVITPTPTPDGGPPIGLSFANTNPPINTIPGTDDYGGGFGSANCMTDYFGQQPAIASMTPFNGGAIPSTANTTTTLYSSGSVNISASAILPGAHVKLYVNGNVDISGNITYTGSAGGWATTADIPSLWIIAEGTSGSGQGDITINGGVITLNGIFVAQPDDAKDVDSTSGGIISTCNDDPVGDPNGFYNACNHQLTINGALLARKVQLLRTYGNAGSSGQDDPGTNAAEVVNDNPEVFVGESTNQLSPNYSSIANLSPVP